MKSYVVFRKRMDAIAVTIRTYLITSDRAPDTMKDIVTDDSYVSFRDELQVLTDYD